MHARTHKLTWNNTRFRQALMVRFKMLDLQKKSADLVQFFFFK